MAGLQSIRIKVNCLPHPDVDGGTKFGEPALKVEDFLWK